MKVIETCSCGASMEVVEDWVPHVRSTIDAWRKDHRHESATTGESSEPFDRDSDHTGYFRDAEPVATGLGFVPSYATEVDA